MVHGNSDDAYILCRAKHSLRGTHVGESKPWGNNGMIWLQERAYFFVFRRRKTTGDTTGETTGPGVEGEQLACYGYTELYAEYSISVIGVIRKGQGWSALYRCLSTRPGEPHFIYL